jgi:hypothetical protein
VVGFSGVLRIVGGQGFVGQPAGRGSAARRWKAELVSGITYLPTRAGWW